MIDKIKKLIEFDIKKTRIASVMGISRQLLDYRLENNSNFTKEEIFRFNKKYGQLLRNIK